LVLIVGTIYGLYSSGEGITLREIVGSADPYRAMMMGSLLSVLVAALLSMGQGILTLSETIDAWHHGLKTMVLAIVILLLAWSLASVNQQLGTAPFLVSILGERLHPSWIPALVFLLASMISFSTGTSWGTMGVLMPLVLPLAWAAATNQGSVPVPDSNHVLHASLAAVLAGAVWGDHCSPVADTTILSSLASGCDHVDHVRTQLPYAVVVGAVALLIGLIPAGYGFPWWLSLILAAGALCGILTFWGRRAGETAPARGTPAD
jgi:Na+/H+ antiporter NhaC